MTTNTKPESCASYTNSYLLTGQEGFLSILEFWNRVSGMRTLSVLSFMMEVSGLKASAAAPTSNCNPPRPRTPRTIKLSCLARRLPYMFATIQRRRRRSTVSNTVSSKTYASKPPTRLSHSLELGMCVVTRMLRCCSGGFRSGITKRGSNGWRMKSATSLLTSPLPELLYR